MIYDEDLARAVCCEHLQDVLGAEMFKTIGGAKGERNAARSGYRRGFPVSPQSEVS